MNLFISRFLSSTLFYLQNYIATLKRVVESKNGYTANGCNTVEEVVSKYSGFCNKFLRCAIEILKGAKEAKDTGEIMLIVDMGESEEICVWCLVLITVYS